MAGQKISELSNMPSGDINNADEFVIVDSSESSNKAVTWGQLTDAMVERGSNADGEYVRFADGTQMCWMTCVVDLSAASPSFTLPATLASTASARAFLSVDGEFSAWSDGNDRSKAQGNAFCRVESTSAIEIIPSDSTANYTGAEGRFSVFVIGRWF